jgi:hypothetical protein
MRVRRSLLVGVLGGVLAASLCAAAPPALASSGQISIIQDNAHLLSDPAGTLSTFRALGVQMVRVVVVWAQVAPDPTSKAAPVGFDAADPADYSPAKWAPYDRIVRLAQADGIQVDLTLSGGAPRWAEGPGIPRAALNNPYWAWRPSAQEFGLFARAVGERYSGTYVPPGQTASPLPRVSFWAIWNEPNFGEDLGPQAIDGSTVSVGPAMYRGLVGQGWNALQATGHGGDTILIGEVDPDGMSGPTTPSHPQGLPGDFAQTKPLQFIRTLYCVDSGYHELRGAAATAVGCPTTAAASRRFRAQNPALFDATGFADHPYLQDQAPDLDPSSDPDIATLPRLPNLERELDRVQQLYGSHRRLPIYNTEFGYITDPPGHGEYLSLATAAYYLNWAEYLSWKQPGVASTMQYLLYDPPAEPKTLGGGGFASGLLFSSGLAKPSYAAYRLPLYLPVTSTQRGRTLEVWGCARPARYAILDTGQPQTAEIQFAPSSSGPFRTLATESIADPDNCYFDVRVKFPGSGLVRLAYTYPSAPSVSMAADGRSVAGTTVDSRTVQVSLY